MKLNRISLKLLLVCLSFTLPIAVMLSLMVKAKQKDINFAVWEMKGNQLQRPLEKVMHQVSRHRLVSQQVMDPSQKQAKLSEIELLGDAAINELKAAMTMVGNDLQFTAEGLGKRSREEFTAENLANKWAKIKSETSSLPNADLDKLHKDAIAHVKTMITHSGDISNLILDPDLDSYYLMDVSLLALPQTQDRMQEIAAFVDRMVAQGSLNQDERLQASVYAAFLKEADLDRINASTQTSLNEDQNFYGLSPTLKDKLTAGMTANTQATEPVIAELRKLATLESPKQFDIENFRKLSETALATSYSFSATAFDELDTLLKIRTNTFIADINRAIWLTSLSLLISAILAAGIAISLIRRIRSFSATTKRIADGDLTARNNMKSSDEIGELARSFDSMTDNIERLNVEVASKNEALVGINNNLESLIAERTATIKTILDNVRFGFLLVGRNLAIEEGFSKSCSELLGSNLKAGTPLLNALGVGDSRNGPMYKEFLDQAFDDFLPEVMTLQQLPSRVQLGEKILSLVSTPVRAEDNTVKSILFTIIDATNLEKVEKENVRHKVLVRLLKEMESFKDFLDDTKNRIELCRKLATANEQIKLRAELHTIKGNTAAYDIVDIAKLVHGIEDALTVEVADIDRIESAFVGFLEQNFDILQLTWKNDVEANYEVPRADLNSIMNRVQLSMGADHAVMQELSQWVTTLQYKTTRSLVGALPDYGERLAARLGKPCKVRVENGDLKVNPEVMRPIIQSIVHLVRNAIDHGIEAPHLRGQKNEEGTIIIRCGEESSNWTLTISDDGQGIDSEAIAEKAILAGQVTRAQVQAMSEEEKCKLVFLSGVSTAEAISEISGRGVGMNAVDAAVREAGGELSILSKRGTGTMIQISVPKERNSDNKARQEKTRKAA